MKGKNTMELLKKYGKYGTEKEASNAIDTDANEILYVKNPTEKMFRKAITAFPYIISWFKNRDISEKLQLLAVKTHGCVIRYIDNPTEEMKVIAALDLPSNMELISSPSHELQMRYLSESEGGTRNIVYIKNPCSDAINFVFKNGTLDDIRYLLINNVSYNDLSDSMKDLIDVKLRINEIMNDGDIDSLAEKETVNKILYKFGKYKTERAAIAGIREDNFNMYYVKDPTDRIIKAAIKENVCNILSVKHPSDKMKLYAVKIFPPVVHDIENPTEEMKKIAVAYHGNEICSFKNPSVELQMMAIKDDTDNISYLDNPCSEVIQYTFKNGTLDNIRYILLNNVEYDKLSNDTKSLIETRIIENEIIHNIGRTSDKRKYTPEEDISEKNTQEEYDQSDVERVLNIYPDDETYNFVDPSFTCDKTIPVETDKPDDMNEDVNIEESIKISESNDIKPVITEENDGLEEVTEEDNDNCDNKEMKTLKHPVCPPQGEPERVTDTKLYNKKEEE